MRKVLVTGCAGFIGSHVLERLHNAYPAHEFVGFDSLQYCASKRNMETLYDARFTFIEGNLRDSSALVKLFQAHAIDVVLHFAAESHVDNSFGNSIEFTLTNVLGTHNLLEAARQAPHRVSRFIHVSTDEVYGSQETIQCETAMLTPTNPYAASKAAAEQLVRAYHISYGLPIIITRSNNVYGPRQYTEKLIPKFIGLLQRAEPLTIHGSGQQKRSFLYVDDVARAFEIIFARGAIGEVYNIGTQEECTVLEVIEALELEMRVAAAKQHVTDRPFNDQRYFIDSSKLGALGWAPSVSFQEGLARTVQWYADRDERYWLD